MAFGIGALWLLGDIPYFGGGTLYSSRFAGVLAGSAR
jgi:hypothetical protein